MKLFIVHIDIAMRSFLSTFQFFWIQVSIIAKKTEDFIRELTIEAYKNAENAEASLEYNDIANVVDKHESLTYLKTFIPKKITYKEYVKLNRPKQFLSFT